MANRAQAAAAGAAAAKSARIPGVFGSMPRRDDRRMTEPAPLGARRLRSHLSMPDG
jgi:hypothetical protein